MLMWTEKSRLLCEVGEGGEYHVINGGWEGIRDGDNFLVRRTNQTVLIDDWEEISREDFNERHPDFGY